MPVLELGDGPLAVAAERGVGEADVLLPGRLARPLEWTEHHPRPWPTQALVGQTEQPCGLDPLGGPCRPDGPSVVHRSRQCPRRPQQLPVRGSHHLHVHSMSAVFARGERAADRQAIAGDGGAVSGVHVRVFRSGVAPLQGGRLGS